MAIPRWLFPLLKMIGTKGVQYGPAAWAWLSSHPEVADQVQQQVQRLLRSSGNEPDAMRASLVSMREQVEYLRRSADDESERVRAETWSTSLIGLEHAVEMLRGGSSRADRKRVRARIDRLRADILSAFLAEQIEDAGGPAPLEGRDRSQPDS